MRLPNWTWAYVLFRFGDGVSHALVPLIPLLVYDQPLWTVPAISAAMNLVAVPASFMWGQLMDRHKGRGRRRLAMGGFAVSGLAMLAMATPLPFWLFVVAAAAYTAFGIATAPAASVLLLESVPGKQWAVATGLMARRTGISYLVGLVVAITAGLSGILESWWVFLLTGLMSLAATVVAQRTIVPATGPTIPHHPAGYGAEAIRKTSRRFERPIWFPSRLRYKPTVKGISFANGHPLLFLVGYFLMFAGSALFFSGYPGFLAKTVGLSVGLVLLAQAPSNFATPVVHPWAGHYGTKHGEMQGVQLGIVLRLVAIPVLAVILLSWQGWSYWPMLLFHGMVGISFALMQGNGSCLMARVHRGGRGAGVGNFHAAVALGSLAGSVLATVILAFTGLLAASIVTTVLLLVGGSLIWGVRKSPQFVTPEAE